MTQETEDDDTSIGASPTHIANPELRHEAHRAIVWAMVIGTFLLAVYISQSLLVIFGAMVFASTLDGGARLLGRYLPWNRNIRLTIILVVATALLVWLTHYAGSQVARQAALLPEIIEKQVGNFVGWAGSNGFAIEASNLQNMAGQLMSGVGTVTRALTGVVGGLTTGFLIVMIGVYVAFEPRLYERGMAWMLPVHRRKDFHQTVMEMGQTMRRLMAGRIVGMIFEGVFTWFMLWIYGIPRAALLGILTGLLAFIPNVGAVISGLLMVMVGFSVGTEAGLYTILVYFLVQTFDGYIVIPLIAKKTVDLAPALVLGAQLVMGILFGILGLLLADPLMAMIKVALERRAARQASETTSQEGAELGA